MATVPDRLPARWVAPGLLAVAAAAALLWATAGPSAVQGDAAATPRAALPDTDVMARPVDAGFTASPTVAARVTDAPRVALEDFQRRLVSPYEEEREVALDVLLPPLMAADPAALARMVQQMPAGPLRDRLRAAVAGRWAGQDAAGVARWVLTISDDEERAQAAREAVAALARAEPAQALALAEQLDPSLSDGTLPRMARLWAETDTPAALAWARQRLTEPAGPAALLAVQAVLAAAVRWPEQVAGLVPSLPDGEARDATVLAIARSWPERDAAAASAWVDALPAGPTKERAAAAVRQVPSVP